MKAKYLTFIGTIAAGKGTQAEILAHKYGLVHLSTGSILRSEVASGSDIGLKVQNIMSNGFLVPDELMNEIVASTLSRVDLLCGFILDGYPRSVAQAEKLDEILASLRIQLDKAVKFDITEEEAVHRIAHRFSCADCGHIYHDISNKTRVAGVCDKCRGTNFRRRADDRPEVLKIRIDEYKKEIEPILAYYKKQNKLVEIDATGRTIEDISDEVIEKLS